MSVLVDPNTTRTDFEQAAATAGATRSMTGLGNAALRTPDDTSIFVLKGHEYLRLGVNKSSVNPAAVQSLARTAVQRLQP